MPKKAYYVLEELHDNEVAERLKALLERSCLIVNEELYVKAYAKVPASGLRENGWMDNPSDYYQSECMLSREVARILMLNGITSKYKGYKYLIYCCELIHNGSFYDYMVTKDLYPEIARNYNVSAGSVEHAIRSAINSGWEGRAQSDKAYECLWRGFNRKPSNRDFLDALFTMAVCKVVKDVNY